MENCKNCFLAVSCAATADPKITDEERKLVDTALIAQYSDENRRLKIMLKEVIEYNKHYPKCTMCANLNSVSCENCTTNYINFKHKFEDAFDKIMLRE